MVNTPAISLYIDDHTPPMRSNRFEYALLAGTAVLFSTIIAGGQFFADRGLSLFEISFFPLLGSSVLLLPFALRGSRRLTRDDVLFFIVYGLVGAMLNLSQFGAVVYGVPIAVVVFLLYTEPAWTLLLSQFFLGERMTYRSMGAVAISLVGIILMLAPSSAHEGHVAVGVVLGLIAGLCFSLWIVMGRTHGIHHTNYKFETFCFSVSSVLWLALLHPLLVATAPAPSLMRLSWSFPSSLWILLIGYACLSDTLPNVFFYKAIEHVKASTAGIIMLLEPLAAAFIGTVVFHQAFTLRIALGGLLILAANVMIVRLKN